MIAEDRERWCKLFRGYVTFYQCEVTDAQIALTWSRLLDQAEPYFYGVIATVDGEIAGFANLLFHRSTWSPTQYCYLEDLFVDPSFRRRGLGEKLIRAAYAEADAQGATRTYWVTQDGNAAARELYDKFAKKVDFVQYRRVT